MDKFKDIGLQNIYTELKRLKKYFNEHNIKFFLIGGCCLGAVREGKLLSYDKDIDIGIFEDTNLEILQTDLKKMFGEAEIKGWENGKILWVKKEIENKILVFEIQVHYRKNGVVFMNRDLGESYTGNNRQGRIEWEDKYFDNFEYVKLEGEEYSVPSPVDKYLEVQHGNWREPKEYTDWRYNIKNLKEGWII